MILYKLQCKKGHEFEAWFASSDAFDRQKKRGQLSCPSCGMKSVSKALMAPNVAPRSRRKTAPERPQPTGPPKLRKLRAEVEAKSEYVGPRFPEEARKIHYEEVPARGIHGEATAEEAKALKDEGIEFYPLPILPEDQN
jgi:hypothetical protein